MHHTKNNVGIKKTKTVSRKAATAISFAFFFFEFRMQRIINDAGSAQAHTKAKN